MPVTNLKLCHLDGLTGTPTGTTRTQITNQDSLNQKDQVNKWRKKHPYFIGSNLYGPHASFLPVSSGLASAFFQCGFTQSSTRWPHHIGWTEATSVPAAKQNTMFTLKNSGRGQNQYDLDKSH